jgi:hypothetical protein
MKSCKSQQLHPENEEQDASQQLEEVKEESIQHPTGEKKMGKRTHH